MKNKLKLTEYFCVVNHLGKLSYRTIACRETPQYFIGKNGERFKKNQDTDKGFLAHWKSTSTYRHEDKLLPQRTESLYALDSEMATQHQI